MTLTRIRRFLEATIHEGLEQLENPVMMVKQYMRELKREIARAEEELDRQGRLHEVLVRDLQITKEIVDRREKQAQIAVDAGEEDLARRALVSKKQASEQVQKYIGLIETSEQQVRVLRAMLEQLQVKYVALRDKKLELTMRVQAVKANEQMKKVKKHPDTRSIEEGFARMEDRVVDLEILNRSHHVDDYNALPNNCSLEIEAELQALKTRPIKEEEGQ